MGWFTPFVVTCGGCGHRNLPDRSPKVGIRLALLGQLPCCRSCGKQLRLTKLTDRPLVRTVRAQLVQEGLLPQTEQAVKEVDTNQEEFVEALPV